MKSPSSSFPDSRTKDGALYLDNAATSWPKPPGVAEGMRYFLDEVGANPGRSGHRLSIEAARIVYDTREAVASLFHAPDPLRVTFGINITDGINLALQGILKSGDHVITTSMEHNAVMRPLHDLESAGVEISQVNCAPDGSLDPHLIEREVQQNTRMIVVNHASNVSGTILPIKEAGEISRKFGLLYLVDTAQTAGTLNIDMAENNIDLLAFTGHKSLYGPMGTGGLIIGDRIQANELHPYRQGGTGSRSEKEIQPDFFPDRFESGTPNAIGLAGLLNALKWIKLQGIDSIRENEENLCAHLIDGLLEIPNVEIYGPKDASKQTATVAFNISNVESSTIGFRLDEEFKILCRVGLHCAPSAHKTLGTFPAGCVRFSLGAFNTVADGSTALFAVRALAREAL